MAWAATKAPAAAMATAIHHPQCGGSMATTRVSAASGRRGARCTAAVAATACAPIEAAAAVRRSARTTTNVAGMWRQVQGCDDWEGLLEHPVLRGEVARYGELVDACYKAFDLDQSSPRHLTCKCGRERMLRDVGLPGAGYEVTRYLYAAPPADVLTLEPSTSSRQGRWIGYVAVSTDEMTRRLGRRDVVVSFRGTVTPAEWAANLMSSLEPARFDPIDPRPDVRVESGFLGLYTSVDTTCRFGGAGTCREQVLREVGRLVESYSSKGEDVSVTLAGHSMGAALALLAAYDLAELGLNRGAPVTVFSFGGPRVGNAAFKARCDALGVKALRVANVHDPITRLPGVFLNEATAGALQRVRPAWQAACYTHVGVELPLDFISVGDLASVHDIGTYVSLLKNGGTRPRDGASGVLAKVMDFVDRQRAAAGAVLPWQDAALQMGGLVQTLGLI